jgi:bifunctional ADP-heptose synthase (sugar kinase/adenylyltransferase)
MARRSGAAAVVVASLGRASVAEKEIRLGWSQVRRMTMTWSGAEEKISRVKVAPPER